MTTAIAARIRFYKDNVTAARWQNFWMNKTVNSYTGVNFDISNILVNRSADEAGLTLTLPLLQDHIVFFLQAIENEFLADVRLYEKEVSGSLPSSFSGMVLISRFVGEVQTMQMDISTLDVSIGAGIEAVSGDIPGRRITTSLVGRLPTL
jgi:hypothetical protein